MPAKASEATIPAATRHEDLFSHHVSTMTHALLDESFRIGMRLCDRAQRDGGGYTWQAVNRSARVATAVAGQLPRVTVGASLYNGVAGIALFLAELYQVTHERRLADMALTAIRRAMAMTRDNPLPSAGFYAGMVGICYAAERVGMVLACEELCAFARMYVRSLSDRPVEDRSCDVIGGAAGAIPALLALAAHDDFAEAASVARALGDHALARAAELPTGLCWPTTPNSVRPLTGLAHGAAGFGLAFLELGHYFREERYSRAGRHAFAYEDSQFDATWGNWPDFRVGALSDALATGSVEELRAQVRAGQPPRWDPNARMVAWCHGASGITLARLRALALGECLEDASAAIAGIVTTAKDVLANGAGNYSLCHGLAGNCEILLRAADQLSRPEWARLALDRLNDGVARYGSTAARPWPSGAPLGLEDPSLMLGDAGIGLALLRVASPDTPSVLLIEPTPPRQPTIGQRPYTVRTPGAGAPAVARGRCAWRYELQQSADNAAVRLVVVPGEESSAQQSSTDLASDPIRDAIDELLGKELDMTDTLLDRLGYDDASEVEWRRGTWRLSRTSRLVRLTQSTLRRLGEQCPSAVPSLKARFALLTRHELEVRVRFLEVPAGFTLSLLREPCSVHDLTARVARHARGIPSERVARWVQAQLHAAYRAHIVVRNWPLPADRR